MVNIHDVLQEISNLNVISSQSPNKTQQRAALKNKNKEKGMEREERIGKGREGKGAEGREERGGKGTRDATTVSTR